MPPRTRDAVMGLIQADSARIRSLGVRRLGLFGSFARENPREGSDVDLLVDFEPGEKTFDNFMGLTCLLEELLQRRVELVTEASLSPYIGPRILEEIVDVPLGA